MRLFVGVELDDRVRKAAHHIADSLRRDFGRRVDARWVSAENLHITLWFLGEVADACADRTLRVLSSPFREMSFQVAISGLGAFPPSGAARVFWLGVRSGMEPLGRLNAELAERLPPLGFEQERRAYSAHLTIARVKEISRGLSHRDLRDMLSSRPADAGNCRIEAVTIFRSRVSSKGATYEALQRVQLQ